ncbi:hypothetical protein [Kitasatospora aureofaciens]|uniref:hypothetical protein n=1 Tax=Kitasatospora aureofaciens TaxID=1894 RepID=UPI001C45F802|nr:hypothetical protein [Kitasatospora aureofaciens]MBV6696878.1 hypothetical protein [Kitasatospora aureofaciens]
MSAGAPPLPRPGGAPLGLQADRGRRTGHHRLLPAGDRPGHQRATVAVTLLPARGYSWAGVLSSDPAVAAVTDTRTDADGTGHAVVHALAVGTAQITSSDTYTPDRFGPPTPALDTGASHPVAKAPGRAAQRAD